MDKLASHRDARPRPPPARKRALRHGHRVLVGYEPYFPDHAMLREQRPDLAWPPNQNDTGAPLAERVDRTSDDRPRCVVTSHRVDRDDGLPKSGLTALVTVEVQPPRHVRRTSTYLV